MSIYAHDFSPFDAVDQGQIEDATPGIQTHLPSESSHSPTILSLPPASLSLPVSASASARTKPTRTRVRGETPANAKAEKHKNAIGSSHDIGRKTSGKLKMKMKMKDGRGGVGAGGQVGRKTKRGPRGKFVSNATLAKERLLVGSSSGSSSGLSSTVGSGGVVEVGVGVGVGVDVRQGGDERVSNDELHQTSYSQTADAPSQASYTYPSIEQQDRSEDMNPDVRVACGESKMTARKSREKAFRCPVRCSSFFLFYVFRGMVPCFREMEGFEFERSSWVFGWSFFECCGVSVASTVALMWPLTLTFARRAKIHRPSVLDRPRIYALGFCYDTYMPPHAGIYALRREHINYCAPDTMYVCMRIRPGDLTDVKSRCVASSRRVEVVSLPMRICI